MKRKLQIWQDTDTSSPREDCDNLSTFVSFNRWQEHGDKNAIEDLIEEIRQSKKISELTLENCDTKSLQEVFELAIKSGIIAAYKPLYIYRHSGDTISSIPFSCPWDSWEFGFAYISKDKARSEYGCKRVTKKLINKMESIIESEIKDYDTYLTEGIFGFSILNEEENVEHSCGGFLGNSWNTNGMKEHIDEDVVEQLEEAFEDVQYG